MISKAAVPMNKDGVEPYMTCVNPCNISKTIWTHRRIVHSNPDVSILNLIKGVDVLNTITEQLMEHKANPSSSTELIQTQIIRISVNERTKFSGEFGDDGDDHIACVAITHGAAEGGELCVVFL